MIWRIRYTLIGCRRFWGGWKMLQCWWAWSGEWDQTDCEPSEAVESDLEALMS